MPQRTLLLTGANNHDWARSAPFCQSLLEKSGFSVTLCREPSEFLEDAEALARFDLLFVDYNGPLWSDLARQNFVAAIEGGAGLVIFHAANNAFGGWEEYEQMCGLLWRGKAGSGHGEFSPLEVRFTTPHPATQNLSDFSTEDELYHGMIAVPNARFTVLATAFSDPARKGSGRDEPAIVAGQYGKGRIFHHLLGHLWKGDPDGEYRGASLVALENPGFGASLLRGCAWAARD